MVAALSDLHIREMFRCEAKTRGAEIRDINRTRRDIHQWSRGRRSSEGSDDLLRFAELVRAAQGRFVRVMIMRLFRVQFRQLRRNLVLGSALERSAGGDLFRASLQGMLHDFFVGNTLIAIVFW